jgi:hypothetical protein
MSRAELAELISGDKVLYQDEVYSIVHIYESGYIEIRENMFRGELVHYSEIKKVD